MLVIVTYDVSTISDAGKKDCERFQRPVKIMVNESKTPYLNALSIQLNLSH